MEPRRLGRYEILRPLARGGMAELFLARATGIEGFEKLIVVKRILPELQSNREYVDMFLEEARLQAGLHHSNIVQVYDIGEADGVPFFAMEYLQAADVRRLLRAAAQHGERMPLEHALAITIGVTAGLCYAHGKHDAEGKPLGIVHRDVSPHNIAVTFDGGVKLLDFGVAKTRKQKSFTRHGTLKGKVGYMSPEQCRGDDLDGRSDLFAVAIVLWEMLAGRKLYGGKTDFGVMKSIVEADAPRPSLFSSECPPELDAIVLRGLERDRERRWQSAEELQLSLEAFARERRLAVSGVGLGRWVRERAGVVAAAEAEAERTTSLYEVAAEDDASDATVLDGVVAQKVPARRTRAVARRRSRAGAGRAVAAVGLAAAVALGGWRVAVWRSARATNAARAKMAAPSPPVHEAPRELPAPVEPAAAPEPAPPTTAAANEEPTHPSRGHADRPAHKRVHATHKPAGHVDLDAPLPPR